MGTEGDNIKNSSDNNINMNVSYGGVSQHKFSTPVCYKCYALKQFYHPCQLFLRGNKIEWGYPDIYKLLQLRLRICSASKFNLCYELFTRFYYTSS